ncbi:MAG: ABC transporter permease [Gemmataceae bacterium]
MPMNMPRLAELPPSAWAVVAVLLGLTAMLLLRRVWSRLLGPVFVWETERLARRSGTFVLRVLFIAALLAALYSAWPAVKVIPTGAGGDELSVMVMRRFSQEFSNAFLVAQSAVLLLLTPVYVGGVITDEKEKRSFDFLLVTRLSNRDIVLGKLGSRLLSLFTVALAALPVLAVTLLFGGVDLPRLFAGLAATALTVLSVGSFTLLCSVCARRTWVAIAFAYGATLLASGVCLALPLDHLSSPLVFYWNLDELLDQARSEADVVPIILEQVYQYALLHLSLAAVCLLLAWALVRRLADRGLAAALLARPVRRQSLAEKPRPVRVYRTRATIPLVGDYPLLWKERYLGRGIIGTVLHNVASIAFAVFALILAGYAVFLGPRDDFREAVAHGLRILVVIAGILLVFGLGLRLAGSISRERERQTLESLTTIPAGRGAILGAKWLAAWLRMRRYVAGLLFAAALALYGGRVAVLPCLMLLVAVAVHGTFAATLGLYLSLVCRTTARAYITLFVILVSTVAGSWLVSALVATNEGDRERDQFLYARELGIDLRPEDAGKPDWFEQLTLGTVADAVNPVRTWWHLMNQRPAANAPVPYGDSTAELSQAGYTLGVLVYLSASLALWLLALRRFRREAGRDA